MAPDGNLRPTGPRPGGCAEAVQLSPRPGDGALGDLLEVAANAFGAICVVDGAGTLRFCNEEARRLLAPDGEEVTGRTCEAIFGPKEGCRLLERALAGEPIGPVELRLPAAGGQRRGVQAVPLPVPGEDGGLLLSLFPRPEPQERMDLGDPPLTTREREVLQCLVDGMRTEQIAGRLGITRTTVRNHVQRLLRKLGVHSKLEAVAIATRHGMVPGAMRGGRAGPPA